MSSLRPAEQKIPVSGALSNVFRNVDEPPDTIPTMLGRMHARKKQPIVVTQRWCFMSIDSKHLVIFPNFFCRDRKTVAGLKQFPVNIDNNRGLASPKTQFGVILMQDPALQRR